MALDLSIEVIGIVVGLVVLTLILTQLYGVAGNWACPASGTGILGALGTACSFVTSFGGVLVIISVILMLVAVIYKKTGGTGI